MRGAREEMRSVHKPVRSEKEERRFTVSEETTTTERTSDLKRKGKQQKSLSLSLSRKFVSYAKFSQTHSKDILLTFVVPMATQSTGQ